MYQAAVFGRASKYLLRSVQSSGRSVITVGCDEDSRMLNDCSLEFFDLFMPYTVVQCNTITKKLYFEVEPCIIRRGMHTEK